MKVLFIKKPLLKIYGMKLLGDKIEILSLEGNKGTIHPREFERLKLGNKNDFIKI
jgi:hypothetical protein